VRGALDNGIAGARWPRSTRPSPSSTARRRARSGAPTATSATTSRPAGFANHLDFQDELDRWCDPVNAREHRSTGAGVPERLQTGRTVLAIEAEVGLRRDTEITNRWSVSGIGRAGGCIRDLARPAPGRPPSRGPRRSERYRRHLHRHPSWPATTAGSFAATSETSELTQSRSRPGARSSAMRSSPGDDRPPHGPPRRDRLAQRRLPSPSRHGPGRRVLATDRWRPSAVGPELRERPPRGPTVRIPPGLDRYEPETSGGDALSRRIGCIATLAGNAALSANHVSILAPHLDDAALSLGASIASAARRGVKVNIVTVFANNPKQSGPASPWDRGCGFSTASDAALGRRAEDLRACRLLGAEPIWLPFPDEDYAPRGARDESDEIWPEVERRIGPTDVILAPGWPLVNIDHAWLTRATICRSQAPRVGLYVEQPYATDQFLHGSPDGGLRRRLPDLGVAPPLRDLLDRVCWHRSGAELASRIAKHRAITEYASQRPSLRRLLRVRIAAYETLMRGERVCLLPAEIRESSRVKWCTDVRRTAAGTGTVRRQS
jgi:LmbE family N-acetylglucosaminyl deacetylase